MKSDDDYEMEDFDDAELESLESLDYEDDSESRLLRFMTAGFVFCAVAGFVALAWYAYQNGMKPIDESEIPLVEAETSPIKEKPEDPGGMQFAHQDKAVYNQLAAGEDAPNTAERLLPPPEQPVQRPQVEEIMAEQFKAETVSDESASENGEVVMAPVAKGDEPAEDTNVTLVTSTSKKDESTMAVIESKPAPEAKPTPKPVEVKVAKVEETPKPVKASGTSSVALQLGAFSSNAEAEQAYKKIQSKFASLISGKNHRVNRVELPKGVFHRLQLTGFASEDAARSTCKDLQAQKQGCFVVK